MLSISLRCALLMMFRRARPAPSVYGRCSSVVVRGTLVDIGIEQTSASARWPTLWGSGVQTNAGEDGGDEERVDNDLEVFWV